MSKTINGPRKIEEYEYEFLNVNSKTWSWLGFFLFNQPKSIKTAEELEFLQKIKYKP